MSLLRTFSRRLTFALAASVAFVLATAGGIAGGVSAAGLDISEDDLIIGNKDAPVTIIEYASMSCPHCATFHNGDYKKLKTDYIDTGKVRFVYRDLPWNGPAFRAALMTRCLPADRQPAAIALVYATQNEWLRKATNETSLQNALNEIFAVAGLTPEQAEVCINDKVMQEKILSVRAEALDVLNVSGTPYLFINKKTLNREDGYESIQKQIDNLLN